MMRPLSYVTILALLIVAACAPIQSSPDPIPSGAVACTNPRPEICTMEYHAVCGSTGQTYGNGCSACGDKNVDWYTDGPCPGNEDLATPKIPGTACTMEFNPVCGENGITYGNPCMAQAEGMGYTMGECSEQEEFIDCTEPRPEFCTKEYNPVCAAVDNGIRCITQPCPSTDWKTYSTGCTACSDPKVAGYKPGACNPEIDNNPSDDVPPCAATTCLVGMTCVEGKGCVAQNEERYMLCNYDEFNRTELAEQAGFTCVDKCPVGYDQFAAQMGMMCIKHMGREEILSWKMCSKSTQCTETETCAYASHTTDGKFMPWFSKNEGFRCVPQSYSGFLINMGMTMRDENGQESTVIA